jgi:hypothetical protein
MNDDLTLLASAYLDGDVTADERARVENDPELAAEVERLRSVRALLADVEPSSITVRESLLANALDAWDRLPVGERNGAARDATPLKRGIDPATAAAAATITAPTSLAARRRTTVNRRLLAAAAAIVVVLAGGVVLQTVFSGRDDSSASLSDQQDAATATAAEALVESAQDAQDARAATAAGADVAPADAETDSGGLDTGINTPAPPTETDLEQLNTPEELGIFASDAVGAPQAPDVPAATSGSIDDQLTQSQASALAVEWPLCLGADFVVGPARYGTVEVVVGVDESRSLALAYVADNCREVARARLP